MNPAAHVFSRHSGTARRRGERWILGVFGAATYFVLACGFGVFGMIVVKGAGAVFSAEAPYVNVPFLTEAPESLHVFDFEGRHYEQGDREHRRFVAAHPAAAKVKAESYVYSSGGIFPCIVGTVLLVVGAMTIALSLGVAAAIYLNEYARDGRFIRMVRLAILNLAGVPSIVFGLFGFGMFVIFFGWNVSLLAGWFTLAFMVLPVVITVYKDKTFSFITKSPPASILIKKIANIAAGSKEPNKQKVGKLTKKQVLDIVKIKMKDLNARDESAAYRIIAGTARQMGVEVEAQ